MIAGEAIVSVSRTGDAEYSEKTVECETFVASSRKKESKVVKARCRSEANVQRRAPASCVSIVRMCRGVVGFSHVKNRLCENKDQL